MILTTLASTSYSDRYSFMGTPWEKDLKKRNPCQKLGFEWKLVGKYKHLFALITPFETLIDSDRNLNNPGPIISQGFIWSHWSITMHIFPCKFPLKDWFLVRKHFPCSFWICQSIPLFHKFSSCDVITSLYYSLNSQNLIVKGIHHAHVTSAIRMIIDYLKPTFDFHSA